MKSITITHLITELNMGGAEQMLFKLVTRMDRTRFRCLVVSMTDQGPIGKKIAAAGIPVISLGMGLGRPSLSGLAKFYHLLRQESVDIIQTWLYHADLLGLLVGRVAEVKRVIWGIRCSDMRLRQYRPLTALTVRMNGVLSQLVDAIVVNSQEGKRIHRKRGYRTDRMVLIPNGFDTGRFRPDASARSWLRHHLGIPPEAFVVGMVARFDPMKDQANFLQAATTMAEGADDVHFLLVGRGMVPENEQLIPHMGDGLSGRIHLLGIRDDIPRILAGLDLAVSSSLFGEGFSNTIGEAMSCGVPCVVTDVGDSPQIVGDTGKVVPPGNAGELSQAMSRIYHMAHPERERLGELARRRIMDNYALGDVVRRFEDFYEQMDQGFSPNAAHHHPSYNRV